MFLHARGRQSLSRPLWRCMCPAPLELLPLWRCMRPSPRAPSEVSRRLLHGHARRKDLNTGRLRPTGLKGVSLNELRKRKLREIAEKPAISLDKFRTLAAKGEATAEDACVMLYHAQAELKQLALPEGRDACARQFAGAVVLQWIRSQSEDKHADICAQDGLRILIDLTSWFLVGEGRDEFLWQWLQLEAAKMKESSATADALFRKHNHVHFWLAGTSNGLLYWQGGNPTEALQYFKRALDLFGHWTERLGRTTFMTGIMVSLMRVLKTDKVPPCDLSLFELFSDAVVRHQSGFSAAEEHAWLRLYHPTEPSGWPAFHLTIGDAPHQKEMNQIWNARGSTKDAWCGALLRAAYILRLQGHTDEAAQLDLIVQEKSPIA